MDVSSGTSFKASLASITVDSTLHNKVGLGRAGTNQCREDTKSNQHHQPHCHGLKASENEEIERNGDDEMMEGKEEGDDDKSRRGTGMWF